MKTVTVDCIVLQSGKCAEAKVMNCWNTVTGQVSKPLEELHITNHVQFLKSKMHFSSYFACPGSSVLPCEFQYCSTSMTNFI